MDSASPFGRYAEGVATVVALAVIFSWLFGLLFNPEGITNTLDNAAWVCLGYVFARSVASARVSASDNEAQRAKSELAEIKNAPQVR